MNTKRLPYGPAEATCAICEKTPGIANDLVECESCPAMVCKDCRTSHDEASIVTCFTCDDDVFQEWTGRRPNCTTRRVGLAS